MCIYNPLDTAPLQVSNGDVPSLNIPAYTLALSQLPKQHELFAQVPSVLEDVSEAAASERY